MARPIVMPSLGMYTAEGTLTAWLRPAGATIAAGEPVAEITTEKATYEIEAPEAGVLHLALEPGATVPVQGVIGWIMAAGEAAPPVPAVAGSIPSLAPAAPTPSNASVPTVPTLPGAEIKASPVARRLAAQHGLDLARLTGSGPGGRIVEADILAAVAAGATPIARPERRVARRSPLVGLRRTIAERLRQSIATTLPVTLMRQVDAEALAEARAALSVRLGRAVPYDALFVKLLAVALRENLDLNAVVEDDTIVVLDEINVGFAVAVPDGLVVPVVRDADARPLAAVLDDMDALAGRVRAGQVRPADIAGGTATITNLGGFGVDAFTPILNPPQAAILGIGRIGVQPVWSDGAWLPRRLCTLSLTFDHRVADGAPAAELLAAVARLMGDGSFLHGLAG
ncbi:MAG: 2-oxo acid dehydrogenase subunit E2 [Chloroflexi bacterium]|nr:2-oxo acid dehydrogenase subunit E2 [Chloroflexota bacterium]